MATEEADWARLFEDHYRGLVARLTMVLRDRAEAEDVAQEAYVRAFHARARFDGANPGAWLHTIGLRLALNELRRRRRWLARQIRAATVIEASIPDLNLWEALRTLSPHQRAALMLHLADGFSLDETAKILGVPVGTAASWVSRARHRLRAELAEE